MSRGAAASGASALTGAGLGGPPSTLASVAPPGSKPKASHARIAAVVSLYFGVSIAMVFVNKELLSGKGTPTIPAPLFVTWYQCLVTIGICFVLGKLSSVRCVGLGGVGSRACTGARAAHVAVLLSAAEDPPPPVWPPVTPACCIREWPIVHNVFAGAPPLPDSTRRTTFLWRG
jgi:hypothetical protein